ncbi:MAG: MarR family transcriptional regulator [Actinomycetota bacterium]|nr:MarR family transcriptional regulator [Actinomycetota bacterium]
METRTTLTAQQLTRMATDLRLACMRISRRVRYESSHDVAPHQFSVLCRLEETPRTPGELADIERVAKPSMTRTLAALVERGLVGRQADPTDGRQVIVSITAEGRASVRSIRRQRDAWMASRVANLTPEEQDVLQRAAVILDKVAGQ